MPSIFRQRFRKALPAYLINVGLSLIPGYLERYTSFATTTNLYIWTTIWMATFLVTLGLHVQYGPLTVACTGCIRNLCMLWVLYYLVGSRECRGNAGLTELVVAGVITAVAVGVSYCLALRFSPSSEQVAEHDAADNVEKAHCGP